MHCNNFFLSLSFSPSLFSISPPERFVVAKFCCSIPRVFSWSLSHFLISSIWLDRRLAQPNQNIKKLRCVIYVHRSHILCDIKLHCWEHNCEVDYNNRLIYVHPSYCIVLTCFWTYLNRKLWKNCDFMHWLNIPNAIYYCWIGKTLFEHVFRWLFIMNSCCI